ncbi:MAG TPA: FAD-binding oxidoreductase [Gemmatimonadaceae bacterium]|nr:FAD-binding oxidoreductase [Gemmatimonadaceae bacterium]
MFRTDEVACALYSETAAVARVIPRAVAVPADAEDVITLARWAAAQGQSLVPRGSGSSMAGGALGEGVIVDFARLGSRPELLGTEPTIARVGPAVTRDALEEVAAHAGLTFPVDPSSSGFATLGGMCATNAAGARTVLHGAMRRWVHGLDCVFADGSRAWLRRGERPANDAGLVPALQRFHRDVAPRVRAAGASALRHEGVRKESSGYGLADWLESGDDVDLIIGSEGTLACIVGLELRLKEAPGATASVLAGFLSLEAAVTVAARLAELGASAVELLDRSFLEVAASDGAVLPLPAGLEAVLIIEAEGASHEAARSVADELAASCRAGGAEHIDVALGVEDELRLWHLRHAASPILNRLAPRLQSMQLVEDGCVPLERFVEYVRGVRGALDDARLAGVIFGHAGDGHAHVNALVDVTEADWRERVTRLVSDVTALVARLGGTLAGEHGDGRLRAPLMSQVWRGEALALFAATKAAFDPDGVLNPGVKIAAAGARALEGVKYDPALTPLPRAAREALDRVVREKAWGTHRLALLGEAAAAV